MVSPKTQTQHQRILRKALNQITDYLFSEEIDFCYHPISNFPKKREVRITLRKVGWNYCQNNNELLAQIGRESQPIAGEEIKAIVSLEQPREKDEEQYVDLFLRTEKESRLTL